MTIDLMKRVVAAFDAPDGMPEFCKAIDDMRQAIKQAELIQRAEEVFGRSEQAEQQERIFDCPRCGHCCPGTAEQAQPIAWMYEDELPEGYPYDAMFEKSRIIEGVRMFPANLTSPQRQAIAEAEQPVAWLTGCPECGMDGECNCKPEQAQPVAWATKEDFYRELDRAIGRVRKQMEVKAVTMRCKDYDLALPIIDMHFGHVLVGQVTAPPQRQPLTDEELGAMLGTGINGKVFKQIARAIEAAHGIKEDKK